LDRSELARSLSRAGRESHGLGAIYWGAATLVAPSAAEAASEPSGVRLAPFDDAASEPTYDATNDAETDEMTPRAVSFVVPPEARDAGR